MSIVRIPPLPFHSRLFRPLPQPSRRADRSAVRPTAAQERICEALAQMVPSTAAEIAEATGLDPETTEACLDGLASRYRVMFNPLTKRFSLPKTGPHAALAA